MEKIVEKQHQDEQRDKVTTTTETTDCTTGKKTVVTVTTDKSKITTDTDTNSDINSTSKTETTTTYTKDSLMISAMVATDALQTTSASNTLVFGAQVQKRLIGPIWIGAFGFSDKRVGVSAGLTF